MDINSLAFIMTDRCSASCRMCCFSCTPKGKHVLDAGRMKRYMDEAKALGTITSIAFSGGEAILHYGQLLDCVTYAAKLGFNVTLVTNGFWAADYEKGYAKMERLVKAGLRQVSVSLDKYHQEFVPIETARKALQILIRLGVLSMLTIMDTRDNSCLDDTLDALRPEIYSAQLIMYPLFSAGAAKENIADDQFLRLCQPETATCPYDNSIIVLFDGSLMMCCAQYSQEIPMVQLGTFENNTLQEAIRAFRQNDFAYVLLSRGFGWYVEKLKEMGYALKPCYGVSCELCHEIFTNEEWVSRLEPVVAGEAGRMRVAKLLG